MEVTNKIDKIKLLKSSNNKSINKLVILIIKDIKFIKVQ